jgi:Fur family zinc uptake transcriptional regulator
MRFGSPQPVSIMKSRGLNLRRGERYRPNRLMRDGLAHRLESMNAYVACADPQHRHDTAIFAICHDCGHIDEMHEGSVVKRLMRTISKYGFAVDQTTIEIQGLCASCAESSRAK